MSRTKPHIHCPGCGLLVNPDDHATPRYVDGRLWHSDCHRGSNRYEAEMDMAPEDRPSFEYRLQLLNELLKARAVTRQEADLIKAYLKGQHVPRTTHSFCWDLGSTSGAIPCYCRKDGTHSGNTRKKQRRQKVSSIAYEHHGNKHVWGGKVGLYGDILIHERRRKDRRRL